MSSRHAFRAPFKHIYGKIFDANNAPVLDVRGWGYLTGNGCLGLPEDEAAEIQDRFGNQVAELLTKHWCEL